MSSQRHAIRDLLAEDPRYKAEAYQFIREALQYANENLELPAVDGGEVPFDQSQPTHVTGQQLCEACRLYARDQYGYLAKMVLSRWGVESTGDFGELVYNLIRI